jgi:NAD(P)-dependent dehydrogenase (short-subunit alcohol dehydrogenase family)
MPLDGKVVVVTGSTSGIGRGIAIDIAAQGARVLVHGRDEARGREVLDELVSRGADARLFLGDLGASDRCEAIIQAAVAAWGRVDILVNNAGGNYFTGVEGTSLESWQECLNIDLRAAWLCAKAAVPFMARGSAIVTMSSDLALRTNPGWFPYNVAKAGMLALTQSLALDLAPRGIRANAIIPGWIDTPINDRHYATFPDPEAERRRVLSLHPLGRVGTPVDIARAVRFLALDEESGFITGVSLIVDGGRSARTEDPPVGAPFLRSEAAAAVQVAKRLLPEREESA